MIALSHMLPPHVDHSGGVTFFKLAATYCIMAEPIVSDGKSILFWTDNWNVGGFAVVLRERFPGLYSFAIDGLCSIHELMTDELISKFHLPLFCTNY